MDKHCTLKMEPKLQIDSISSLINFDNSEMPLLTAVKSERDFDEDLILMVKSFPAIYDQSEPDFSRHPKREETWRTIAAAMNSSVESVQCRWRLLRESYARQLKKVRLGEADRDNSAKWKWFDIMGFLQPHVRSRRRIASFLLHDSCSYNTSSMDCDEIDVHEPPAIMPATSASQLPSTLDTCAAGSTCSDDIHGHDARARSRKRARDDVSTSTMIDELSKARDAFNGFTSRFVSNMNCQDNSRVPARRIDALCQLMSQRYTSLPLDLQEEFDIKVLSLLRDFSKEASQMAEAQCKVVLQEL